MNSLAVKCRMMALQFTGDPWERRDYEVTVWEYYHGTITVRPLETVVGYYHGLFRCYVNGLPARIEEFDKQLKEMGLDYDRVRIRKEIEGQ